MNSLSNYLVEQILLEDKSPIKDVVVVYVGRFQPMHKGHYAVYDHLTKKFGKKNVFVGTSDKVEKGRSPFTFREKQEIMYTMFGIPKNRIVNVKNPYAPTEVLKNYNENTTAFVTVVGEKDKSRLGGKYFQKWDGEPTEGYKDKGYVYVAPSFGGGISGTETRNGLSLGSDEQKKDFFKNRVYGKYNEKIFRMITDKLEESFVIRKETIEDWIINEHNHINGTLGVSDTGDMEVDDGPNSFFPNFTVFNEVNVDRAIRIGYEVLQKIMDDVIEDYPIYPNGPVDSVTFYPAGVIGKLTTTNQIEYYDHEAYDQWYKHARRVAGQAGYQLVQTELEKLHGKEDKEMSGDDAIDLIQHIDENINIPVKVGDTILTGRFKNKKVVVKQIGKDDHGMPTINGKKVVNFRLVKEGFSVLLEDKKEDEKYTHIGYGNFKLKGKEKDKNSPTFTKDASGKYIQNDKDKPTTPSNKKSAVSGTKSFSHAPDIKNKPQQDKKELVKSTYKNLKSRKSSNGESLDFETTSKGSMIIGVEHEDDKSTKETIKNIQSLPKNTKVMFVGEGGMTKDENGKFEFVGEQDEIRNATLNHFDNAEESSWDENANIYDNSSPVFDSVAQSLGGSKSKSNASIWSNMVSQGDDLDADDYLDDEGKEWLISQAKKGGATGFDSEVDWNNLTDQQKEDLYQLNFRDDDRYGETEIYKGQESYNNFRQNELDRKIKEAEDKGYTVIAPVGNSHVDLWRQRNKPKSVNETNSLKSKLSTNEIIGQTVDCQKCNHSWEIRPEDTTPYLCHNCGYDNQTMEYDYDEWNKWKKEQGIKEEKRIQFYENHFRNLTPSNFKLLKEGNTIKIILPTKLNEISSNGGYRADAGEPDPVFVTNGQVRKLGANKGRPEYWFENGGYTQLHYPKGDYPFGKGKGKDKESQQRTVKYKVKNVVKSTLPPPEPDNEGVEKIYETIKNESLFGGGGGMKPYDKLLMAGVVRFMQNKLGFSGKITVKKKSSSSLFGDISLSDASSRGKFTVHYNPNYSYQGIIKNLIHELIHAKQIAKGELKPSSDYKSLLWKGKPFISVKDYSNFQRKDINQYKKLPWEKEAYEGMNKYYRMFLNSSEFKELVGKDPNLDYILSNLNEVGIGTGQSGIRMGYPDKDQLKKRMKDVEDQRKRTDSNKEFQYEPINEGQLEDLGITDFKSLFKKMPSDLQKRVYNLKNVGQRLDKHPEGNVLKHTITVVNRSIKDDDIDIAIAAMFHDIGKDETMGVHPTKGHITHFDHEKVSASLVSKYKNWIQSVGGNPANVLYIVKNHMRYKQLSNMRPGKQQKLKSFRAFDKLDKFSKHDRGGLGEGILTEGGAYGHMAHPFDTDINLTFGDLKDIANRALDGTLELTTEKTDGQALAISWRDDRGLIAARNKGHLKNRGEAALDINGVSSKFQGRGGLSDAYNFAMSDLNKAIKSLSPKQREKIFQNGGSFMNLEVIYPTSVNVIPYGQPLLIFHGTMQYNEDGVAVGENKDAARILAGMIKQVNQHVQDNYTIQGPPVIQLPKSQTLFSKKGKYLSQIQKLQSEFGLKDTDGVGEYHQAWWSQWVDKNSPTTLDNKTKMGLVKRWAFGDKSFRLDKNNIPDEKVLEWAQKHEKDNHQKIAKDNLRKFEDIFLGLGAEVLEFTSSALTVNPDKAIREMRKRLEQTAKDVRKSGDPKKIAKLKLELERLNAIGGPSKIVPIEGIVFQYKGKTMKLTGSFASLNQILGIFYG